VSSAERKTYGRTASGKQITDELIDALARKAEAGFEVEELTEPVSPPSRSGLLEPLELAGDPEALSRALDDIRGDH